MRSGPKTIVEPRQPPTHSLVPRAPEAVDIGRRPSRAEELSKTAMEL
jgi:hypothetical protein